MAPWIGRQAAGEIGDAAPEARLAACDRLVRDGYFAEAEAALLGLAEIKSVASDARKLLAVSRQLLRWGIVGKLERYVVSTASPPDFSSDRSVILARRPGAGKIIFVFTGNAKQIWLSIHLLHQLLPHDDCHVVYLKDDQEIFYLGGVDGLGGSYRAAVRGMRELIRSLGDPAAYCLGSSAGGYSSLRYAPDIGARAVLAFAPTTTDLSGASTYYAGTFLAEICAATPDVTVDIRSLYAAAAASPRVTLVFGERHEHDAATCRRLGDLPGVTLLPVADYGGHDAIAQTIANGSFKRIVHDFLAEDGEVAAPIPQMGDANADS